MQHNHDEILLTLKDIANNKLKLNLKKFATNINRRKQGQQQWPQSYTMQNRTPTRFRISVKSEAELQVDSIGYRSWQLNVGELLKQF